MSMLSAQCDELRELAAKYDELKSGATRVVRISLDTGPVLREAADTIWELRCKLADMVDMRERARVAEAENAKLRELLQRALTSHDKMCTNRGTCLGCLLFNAKPFMPACPIVGVTRDARDLGIEVDG